jgi:hypothetical protein
MNQIINMIIRQVTRQLINRGVRAGFDQAGKMADRRKASRGEHVIDPENMTPAEREQMIAAKKQSKQASQRMKTMRRISRF